MPRKTFVAGEILTAADTNTYLMDQSVMTFAGTAARGSAIPTPSEGMVTYLEDSDELQVYTTDWGAVGGTQPGNVIQVVSTTKTDTFSASLAPGAFTTPTGLTASITPSSTSNKVLILVEVAGSGTDGTGIGYMGFRILRDSTVISVGDAASTRTPVSNVSHGRTGSTNMTSTSQNFLDSPNTTSAITYSVEIGSVFFGGTATIYLNRSTGDSDNAYVARGVSSITLMEIAG